MDCRSLLIHSHLLWLLQSTTSRYHGFDDMEFRGLSFRARGDSSPSVACDRTRFPRTSDRSSSLSWDSSSRADPPSCSSGSSGSPEPSPPTAPSALVTFPLGRSGGGNLLVSSAAKVSSASVGGRHLALRGSFMASASGIFKSR